MRTNVLFIIGFFFLNFAVSCDNELAVEDGGKEKPTEPVKIELTGEEQEVVDLQNDFSLDVFAALYDEKQGVKNSLLSPFSLHCALGMLSNGAAGETKKELLEVMHLKGYDTEGMNAYFEKMTKGLPYVSPDAMFQTANSIWNEQSIQLKERFTQLNEEHFGVKIASLDFSDPSSVVTINDWCKETTEGKIPEIIETISAKTVVLLLNSVYFNAKWKNEFVKSVTKNALFQLENGEKVYKPFMFKKEDCAYFNNGELAAIAKPYVDDAFQMYFIRPEDGVTLKEVVHKLSQPGYWNEIRKGFRTYEVEMAIPRFEVESEYDLINTLQTLGMKKAFSPIEADFTAMATTTDQIYVSLVKQAAKLRVDEEGSEGAAVTVIGLDGYFPGTFFEKAVFKADRPFLFMITENETGAILFVGTVETL